MTLFVNLLELKWVTTGSILYRITCFRLPASCAAILDLMAAIYVLRVTSAFSEIICAVIDAPKYLQHQQPPPFFVVAA